MTLLTKFLIIKAMVFPVVMYSCESWTIQKAECGRIDAFKLCCWRRLLRVPWTTRRSNLSILKEINPEFSLEGLLLKLQYFGHLMWRADSLEKTLMLEKIKGKRRRRWQSIRWLDSITNSVDMNWSQLQETVEDRGAWHVTVRGVVKNQEHCYSCADYCPPCTFCSNYSKLENVIYILTFHYFLYEILFDRAVCLLLSSTSASLIPHPFPTGMTLAVLSRLHFVGWVSLPLWRFPLIFSIRVSYRTHCCVMAHTALKPFLNSASLSSYLFTCLYDTLGCIFLEGRTF